MSDFKLADLKEDVEKSAQKKKRNKILLIVAIIAAVIAVAIFVIYQTAGAGSDPVIYSDPDSPTVVSLKDDPANTYGFDCDYLNTDGGYYCSLVNDDVIAVYYESKTDVIDYISYTIKLPNFTTKEEALEYAGETFFEYQNQISESNPKTTSDDMLEVDEPFAEFSKYFLEDGEDQEVSTQRTMSTKTTVDVSYYPNSNSIYLTVYNYGY